MQADPLGLIDGASVYGYAGQSPLVNIDPTGECFGPAAALLPACVVVAGMLYDYFSSDCYTWADFAYSLASNANPWKNVRWVIKAKKWRDGRGRGQGDSSGRRGDENRSGDGPASSDGGSDSGKGLGGNPFKGKTPEEIVKMFENKGYVPKGNNPAMGEGQYVNPKTGRGYHIDAKHPLPKGPHVGVSVPRGSGTTGRGGRRGRDFPL